MSLQELKTLSGLFVVMLSFGLFYSFNIVEPDYAENVHSNDNVAMTDNIANESPEQSTNDTVSALAMTESTEPEEESNVESDVSAGLMSTGTLIKRLNYDVSSK